MSRNIPLKKDFLNHLSPIFFLFQMFCLAPLLQPNTFNRYFLNFFTCTIFLATAYLTYLIVFCFHLLTLPLNIYFGFILQTGLTSIATTFTVIIIESRLTAVSHTQIVHKIFEADTILRRSLGVHIDYGLLMRRKVFNVYAMFTGVFCCNIVACFSFYSETANIDLIILFNVIGVCVLGITLRLSQITFYVDMVRCLLKLIHNVLANGGWRRSNALCCIQMVYALCWEITREINKAFGWSLSFIFVQLILDCMNNGYVTYKNIVVGYSNGILLG